MSLTNDQLHDILNAYKIDQHGTITNRTTGKVKVPYYHHGSMWVDVWIGGRRHKIRVGILQQYQVVGDTPANP